jgi:membrane-bound ClpP family serine protease
MWAIITTLILVGILLLILEILVIPGTGFAGVLGFVSMAAGVWLAYAKTGTASGNITLVSTLVLNTVAVVLSLRSKTWKKAQLKTSIDGKATTPLVNKLKTGDKGITVSRCAPAGKVLINGEYYEAAAGTEFIDPNTEIEIVKIENNKIYIKPIKT